MKSTRRIMIFTLTFALWRLAEWEGGIKLLATCASIMLGAEPPPIDPTRIAEASRNGGCF